MFIKKHHTFRFVLSRIKQKIFDIKYPDVPWMTPTSIDLLEQLIKLDDVGIEYGSGRSTLWFAKRCKYLTSIENNKQWYDIVSKKISKLNNVNYELNTLTEKQLDSSYYKTINRFKSGTIDFIIIDGKYREPLAIKAIEILKNGGLLIFDNAERHLPNNYNIPESIGKSNNGISKLMEQFGKETKTWRRIWTTNGVTATLLMFKP